MKNWKKILTYFLLIVVFVFALLHVSFRLLLKYGLPDYLENNPQYSIRYDQFEIGFVKGDVLFTNFSITTKKNDSKSIQIKGKADTLYIKNLNIIDAVLKKRINTDSIWIVRPDMSLDFSIQSDKDKKFKSPIDVKNIRIDKGTLALKYFEHKYSARQINLEISDISFTDDKNLKAFPFSFKLKKIESSKIFYQNQTILLSIDNATSENHVTNISNFEIRAMKKENLSEDFIDVIIPNLKIQNLGLKENQISFSYINLQNPKIEVKLPKTSEAVSQADFPYSLLFNKLNLNNANINICSKENKALFSVKNFTSKFDSLVLDAKIEGTVPVSVKNFSFYGNDLEFMTRDYYSVSLGSFNGNRNRVKVKNLSLKQNLSKEVFAKKFPHRNQIIEFTANEVMLDKYEETKDQISLAKLYFSGANLDFQRLFKGTYKKSEKAILFKEIEFHNSSVNYKNVYKQSAFSVKDLNGKINSFSFLGHSKSFLPFYYKNFSISGNSFVLNSGKYYSIHLGRFSATPNKIDVYNFAMKPRYSQSQFIKMIPHEKDYYDLKAESISFQGQNIFRNDAKIILLDQVIINKAYADIFRSKIPKDDTRIKPMYSDLLRSIKHPMYIKNVQAKNSTLIYSEDNPNNQNRRGTISFHSMSLVANNINSGKMKDKPTLVPIHVSCIFMNQSPMEVDWGFDTKSLQDNFKISGTIKDLTADRINQFSASHNIKSTGEINNLIFSFYGDKESMKGSFGITHDNLRISILNKENQEERKFVSDLANIFVRRKSRESKSNVQINAVRNKEKSFFNFFWLGIQDGLKKSLTPLKIERIEEGIQKKNENKEIRKTQKEARKATKEAKKNLRK